MFAFAGTFESFKNIARHCVFLQFSTMLYIMVVGLANNYRDWGYKEKCVCYRYKGGEIENF